MLRVTQLQKRPDAFRRLSGVTTEEFHTILELLTPLWTTAQTARLNHRKRQRRIGGGAQFKLELTALLLMALIYLRQYCTQEFLGWLLFDLHKSNVSRNIALLLPILEQALPSPIRARTLQKELDGTPPEGWSTAKRKKIGTLKAFLEEFPEFEDVIVDSTEQERSQPLKPKPLEGKKPAGRKQNPKKFFSGKTKMHALKTQIAVTPDGLIVHQSATVAGPMSDSMLLRRSRFAGNAPPGTRLFGDSAYTGMDKIYSELEVVTPIKKPKGGALSEEQREFNRQVSKVRIAVENTLCRIKTFKVCSDFFRNPVKSHGQLMGVVSGLVNLRIINCLAGMSD
jgi:DDE superfamily endonuclease/Helix-turn-helix of DDE superfamily endonuclease